MSEDYVWDLNLLHPEDRRQCVHHRPSRSTSLVAPGVNKLTMATTHALTTFLLDTSISSSFYDCPGASYQAYGHLLSKRPHEQPFHPHGLKKALLNAGPIPQVVSLDCTLESPGKFLLATEV